MNIPIKIIVVVVIVVLVLISLSFFMALQTSTQITKAEAEKIFNEQCQQYARQGCPWSVTRLGGFPEFLKSCKILFGSERQEYSCLYSVCQACKEVNVPQVPCAGMCEACKAANDLSIDKQNCCNEFIAQCAGVVSCEVCGVL